MPYINRSVGGGGSTSIEVSIEEAVEKRTVDSISKC